MDKSVLPDIKKNVVNDFYLTPDYFEKDLSTLHGSGFSIQPKFSQSAYFLDFTINQKFLKIYILLVQERILELVCQVLFLQLKF